MTIKYGYVQKINNFLIKLYDYIKSYKNAKKPIPQNYNFIYDIETQVVVLKTREEAKIRQLDLEQKVVTELNRPINQCNIIHMSEDNNAGLITQDIMTAMFDLHDNVTSEYNEFNKIVGTPIEFYNHLVRVILRNCNKFRHPKTGKTMIQIYAITFDKADNMSILKQSTQLKRVLDMELYDENSILTEEGLLPQGTAVAGTAVAGTVVPCNPATTDTVVPFNSNNPVAQKIDIRKFMCTRKLRKQLYNIFFNRFKTEESVQHIQIILDFESKGPYYLYEKEVLQRPDRCNRLGEGDLAVFMWAYLYRDYNPIIMGKDKDLYLIALLNAHRYPNTLHTGIYNVTLKIAQHLNVKVLYEQMRLRPGLMESIMIIVMFHDTDFFQRRWIFESANDNAIEETIIQQICFNGLNIFNVEGAGTAVPCNPASINNVNNNDQGGSKGLCPSLWHPKDFMKLLHAIEKEHESKSRNCKKCKLNPNMKQLNWAWMQLMNHFYYWVTLDDFFNLIYWKQLK